MFRRKTPTTSRDFVKWLATESKGERWDAGERGKRCHSLSLIAWPSGGQVDNIRNRRECGIWLTIRREGEKEKIRITANNRVMDIFLHSPVLGSTVRKREERENYGDSLVEDDKRISRHFSRKMTSLLPSSYHFHQSATTTVVAASGHVSLCHYLGCFYLWLCQEPLSDLLWLERDMSHIFMHFHFLSLLCLFFLGNGEREKLHSVKVMVTLTQTQSEKTTIAIGTSDGCVLFTAEGRNLFDKREEKSDIVSLRFWKQWRWRRRKKRRFVCLLYLARGERVNCPSKDNRDWNRHQLERERKDLWNSLHISINAAFSVLWEERETIESQRRL